MSIALTLPLGPSANRYWRNVRGVMVKSEAAREYQEQVGWLARAAGLRKPILGAVAVTLRVFRKQRSGDLDNKIKPLLDSLNGIAWNDDSQIVEIHAFRFDDPKNPRIEVEITEK